MRINLGAEDLFGNEAAEDEKGEIFEAYAYRRPEAARFCDAQQVIQVVRAYKGEGKSALMRLARTAIGSDYPDDIIVDTTGPDLSPDGDCEDFGQLVRSWKSRLVDIAASEIGARVGLAWRDDSIALVEHAERNGFRQRNFVSAIVDRLKSSAVPLERTRPELPDPSKLLARYQGRSPRVWLFIDVAVH